MENPQNILIFATNIRTDNDKRLVSRTLNENSEIHHWNIDQEDIDCVLRVVTYTLSEKHIITLIDRHDFKCTPLE